MKGAVRLNPAEEIAAILDVPAGGLVAFAPDPLNGAGQFGEPPGEGIAARDFAAAKPGAARVRVLDVQRQIVDARRVDDHRNAEIMAMNLHQFRLRHPARRLRHVAALAHRQPERSEEHTSELQSLMRISYAVFCLKKKKP